MASAEPDADDWVRMPVAKAADDADDWVRVPVAPAETSKLETMMRGGAQGFSLGHIDEATAAVGAAKDWTAGKLGLRGDVGFGDAYDSYIGGIRAKDAKAKTDNPLTFGASELAGGAGLMVAAPGLAPARYAKLGAGVAGPLARASKLKNTGKIFGLGTAAAAGLTEAPISSPNFYEDSLEGGVTSLATAGLLKGAGAVAKNFTPTNLARKSANVIFNTPEEITDLYIKNPDKVNNSSTRLEVARRYQALVDKLQNYVTEGSAESRAILTKEGKKFKGSELRKLYKDQADALEARSEGFKGDDQEREAAIAWLRQRQGVFAPVAKPIPPGGRGRPVFVDRELSTNRVKDSIQGIDKQTHWETAPGRFAKIEDNVRKTARHNTDSLLKSRSPAYAEHMKGVASDTELLSQAAPLAKNEAGLANVFRRLQTDQYGGGQAPKEILERVDARMGTDILGEAKYAHAREAFSKSVTNGSRNVNQFSHMLKDVPILKHIAPLIGGTVDKYGRKMTMSAVDTAADLHKIWQGQGIQDFMTKIGPVVAAARKGDAAALLTFQLLEQINPRAAEAAMSQQRGTP